MEGFFVSTVVDVLKSPKWFGSLAKCGVEDF